MNVRPVKTQISLWIQAGWSVFAVRLKTLWILGYPQSAVRIFWSDCVDADADLIIRRVRIMQEMLSLYEGHIQVKIPRKCYNHEAQPSRGTKGRREEEEIRTTQRYKWNHRRTN